MAIPKLTLDTNCIIAVEQHEASQQSILSLRRLHDAGTVQLRLVAASASERQVHDQPVRSFDDWAVYVTNIGFGGLDILKPLGVWDVGIWGQFVWGGGAEGELYDAIGTALFPSWFPRRLEQPLNANKFCDVLMMCAHIWYQGDCFITLNTDDFRKTKTLPKLVKLGAGAVLTPDEADRTFKAGQ